MDKITTPDFLHGEELEAIVKHHEADIRKRDVKWQKYVRWYKSEFHGSHNEARADQVDRETGLYIGMENATARPPGMETNYLYAFMDAHAATIVPPNVRINVKPRSELRRPDARIREGVVNDFFAYNDITRIFWRLSTMAGLKGIGFLKAWWGAKDFRPLYDVVDPCRVYFDPSARRWADVTYVIEVQDVTMQVIRKHVAEGVYIPDAVKLCSSRESAGGRANSDRAKQARVYVLYDFIARKEVHFAAGHYNTPLNAVPMGMLDGRAGNPFYPVTFNDALSDLYGIPDPQLIESPLYELNTLDTLELRYAVSCIPTTFLNTQAFADPEKALATFRDGVDPGTINTVDLAVGLGHTWQSAVFTTPTPSMAPEFRLAREKARQAIEYVLALPGFQRGVVGAADIATEVAVAEREVRTRNGRRQLVIRRAAAWAALQGLALFASENNPELAIEFRVSDSDHEGQTVTAEDLKYGGDVEQLQFDYDLIVTSPPEEARTVRLQALQNMLPMFLQMPDVDTRKVLRDVFYLLDIPEDRLKPPAPPVPPGVMPGGIQGQPPLPGLPPSDTMGMAAGGEIAPPVDVPAGLQGTT
jgi:hypothetical protein